MKILYVITGLPKAAGTSVFCGEVANGLATMGHDVTIAVVNPDAPNLYPLDERVKLTSISSILTTNQLTTNDYNVVHIHGLWSPILHKVSAWAKVNNIPIVWSTHGMTAPWSMRHKWWKKCFYWWLVQKPDLRRAAIIHSTVEQEHEWNAALGSKRHVIAPLGTHLPEAQDLSGGSNDHRTLLFVGRVYPVKALDRLIEAFAQAVQVSGSNWNLRIVGPDQAGHMGELRKLVDDLKCGSIEFAGPKFDADLEAEYANCDCLALVSHTENFGATVVDAMARGKPVITSTKTPWKEVVDHGCGWWVDNDVETLAKALREMFNTPSSQLKSMGAKGRALVESKYTWEAVAKTLERAYRDVSRGCEKGLCVDCSELYDTCSS